MRSFRFHASAVVVGALALAGGASIAQADPLLAPTTACPKQTDASAPARVQAGAMRCLMNYARSRSGTRALRGNRWLAASARTKARLIDRCREFSHSPCGTRVGYGLNTDRYRYTRLGEVIYMGAGRQGTARAGMAAWLRSPGHRASILNGRFRDVGVGMRVSSGPRASATRIWTVDLGRRR